MSEKPAHISEGEWKVRCELAALYRLVALNGWDDLIFTHISARVAAKDSWVKQSDGGYAPASTDHFLINPYGVFFEDIRASELVKIDIDGNIADENPRMINPAGFTIHSAVHAAVDKAHYVLHLHTDHMIAVSTHKKGLMPLTQNALLLLPQLAYHDYEGVAVDLDERKRLVADIGTKRIVILRNHGTLTWGETAAEAFVAMYFLENACRQQVMALSAGQDGIIEVSSAVCDKVAPMSQATGFVGGLAWPGLMRRLNAKYPGYDT